MPSLKHDTMLPASDASNVEDLDDDSLPEVLTPASTVAEDSLHGTGSPAPQTAQQLPAPNSQNPSKTSPRSSSRSRPSPLFEAAKAGHAPMVEKLLDHGVDVNDGGLHVPPSAWSPLCTAAKRGYVDTVKLLISRGANVHLADQDGWTAIHTASRWGHDPVVELLLDAGADPSVRDRSRWTPLHTAAKHGRQKVVELLVARGADTQARDKWGKTPLIVAIQNTYEDTATFLVAHEPREPPPAYGVPAA